MRVKRGFARTLRGNGAIVVLLACGTVPGIAAAAGSALKVKTKKCGAGTACSASLSSPPPRSSAIGAPPPNTPYSTIHVTAQPRTKERITAGSQLIETLDKGRRLICPGYHRRDGSWFEVMLRSRARVRIVYDLTDTIYNTSTAGLRLCLGLEYDFKTRSGKPAHHATMPDGTRGYVGLLPDCPNGATTARGPCIYAVSGVLSRDARVSSATLKAQIPATAQSDPWFGG